MPGERTAFQRTLLLVGSFGPLGHLPASGTITVAAVGIPLFWLTREWSYAPYVIAVTAFTAGSIWLHDIGDRILGEKDSRRLVWDEIVGFMIAVAFVPFTWQTVLIAFFVERAIDIIKVPPARWVERSWPGGWGVVGDDVIAGLYTCCLLHVLCAVLPGYVGLGG